MKLAARVGQLRRAWKRRVKPLVPDGAHWCFNPPAAGTLPRQGWKLHVSATILSAGAVFDAALPILRRHGAAFKVVRTLDDLLFLNTGVPGFSQVGKFLTVYPRSESEAVVLAKCLHDATRGLTGPKIPFDRCLRRGSLVHYRFGVIAATDAKPEDDADLLVDPRGRTHRDSRRPGAAVPAWVRDPFLGVAAPTSPRRAGRIGLLYLPFKAFFQRGKGGVYEAVDLTRRPARLCIIKEGRPHGETLWDGLDARARLRHEVSVLRRLRRAGLPVPEVYDTFGQAGHFYVVLEKLRGHPLLSAHRPVPAHPGWRHALALLDQLGEVLAALHRLGWVWRDLKPSNLIAHRERLWLLDFEGACRVEATEVVPWGSPAYMPPGATASFTRAPGVAEDFYALGVVGFQFATGHLPPLDFAARHRLLRRCGSPPALCERIESLLTVAGGGGPAGRVPTPAGAGTRGREAG